MICGEHIRRFLKWGSHRESKYQIQQNEAVPNDVLQVQAQIGSGGCGHRTSDDI